jgi:hypothetical protein
MPKIAEINELLQGSRRSQNISGLEDKLEKITTTFNSAFSTKLGDSDGQIFEGVFQSMVQLPIDEIEKGFSKVKPVMCTVLKELPGIEDKMKTAISSSDLTELNKIFGSAAVSIGTSDTTVTTATENIMTHKLFCDGAPTNISQMIKEVSGATDTEFEDTVKKVLDEDLQDAMSEGVKVMQSDEFKDLMSNVLTEAKEKFTTLNSGLNSGSFLKDLSENFSGELGTAISKFGDEFTSGKTLDVLNAAFGNLNPLDISAAITTIPTKIFDQAGILGIGTKITSLFDMQDFIGKMKLQAPELETELAALTAKMDTQILSLKSAKTTVASTINDGNTARHRIRNSAETTKQNQFVLLGSQEEIESIIKSAERDITTVVWHWSGHFIDDGYIGAPEINQEFSAGGEAIPYHFVVRRDGSIQTGAPINIETSHVADEFKPLSIGVAFVAGFNGTRGPSGATGNVRLDAASITQAQWKTFDSFMKAFYTIFPGGDAFGNNDLQIKEVKPAINVGPGFDVADKILASPFYRLNTAFPSQDKKFLTRDEIIIKDKASKNQILEEQDIQ